MRRTEKVKGRRPTLTASDQKSSMFLQRHAKFLQETQRETGASSTALLCHWGTFLLLPRGLRRRR